MKVSVLTSIACAMAFAQALPVAKVQPNELQLESKIEDAKSLFEFVIDSVLTAFNYEEEKKTPCHNSKKTMEKTTFNVKHDKQKFSHYHDTDSNAGSDLEDYPPPPSPPGKHHNPGPPPNGSHPPPPPRHGKHHYPGSPPNENYPRPSSPPSVKGKGKGRDRGRNHKGGPSSMNVKQRKEKPRHYNSDLYLNSNESRKKSDDKFITVETEMDEIFEIGEESY